MDDNAKWICEIFVVPPKRKSDQMMKIWCVVNSEIHSSSWWDSVIRHELVQFNYDEVQKLYKGLICDQPLVKLVLFVLYGCTSGLEYCPDLWRHYHYPDPFLPLDIVIQKYNQYTIVEPRIIGSPPFKGCMQHCGYWRLINDWYQICPPIDTIWQTCFSHWRVHQIKNE